VNNLIPQMVAWVEEYWLWLYGVCALGLLACARGIWIARRHRKRTIFKLERETADSQEARAVSILFLFLGIAIAVTAVRFYVSPTLAALPPTPTPTATTVFFTEPPTRVVSPTITPTPAPPTATRPPATATRAATSALAPSPTPAPAVQCPAPGVCIRYPSNGMALSGVVEIRGTAAIERFQFYKIEYGQGENPPSWNSLGDIRREAVANGPLASWNTAGFPPGLYKLRLTVVDITGNFAPPHEIRVTIGP
jgi:hypothetical protein